MAIGIRRRTPGIRALRAVVPAVVAAALACGPGTEQAGELREGRSAAASTPVGTQVVVHVSVVKTYLAHDECGDPQSPPDLYWKVSFDGVPVTTPVSSWDPPCTLFDCPGWIGGEISIDNDISRTIDVTKPSIPIVIEEWDSDSGSDDDKCSISETAKQLNLWLDLAACTISGDLGGTCGTEIVSYPHGKIFSFKVWLEPPATVPGLGVRCLHDPLWPQPGDAITVTAEALDGAGDALGGVINDVQIWADDTVNPASTTAGTPGKFGLQTLSYTYTPPANATETMYRCLVKQGDWVSSGWHKVQVGPPLSGRAVPVVYTDAQVAAADVVFVADSVDYTGPQDPNFLADVHDIIANEFYGGDANVRGAGNAYRARQQALNFWIALDTGTADNPTGLAKDFTLTEPAGWDTAYAFADTGAIVHTRDFRDAADRFRRIYSGEVGIAGVFQHEFGHSPIGLSDEYCDPGCCDGGYFQQPSLPNVYNTLSGCLADPLAVGVAGACAPIGTTGHFRLEPSTTYLDDLMTCKGQRTPNLADTLRINWYFGQCALSGC